MEEPVVQLSDVSTRLRRRWKTVMATALVGAVGALIYTVVVPAQYSAQAALLAPEAEGGMSAQIAAIGQQKADTVSILAGVMQSRTTLAYVAGLVNLPVRKVEKRLKIESDSLSRQVHVTFTHADPAMAKKAVEAVVEKASELDKTVGLSLAGRQAIELEKTVANKAKELKAAEDGLRQYQRGIKTFGTQEDGYTGSSYAKQLQDMDMQLQGTEKRLEAARASASMQGGTDLLPTGSPIFDGIRDELVKAQSDFEKAKATFTPAAEEYQSAKRKLDAVQTSLREEAKRHVQSVNKGVDEKVAELEGQKLVLENQIRVARSLAERAPGEAMGLQRELRKVRIAETTYTKVVEQYEQARVNAQTSKVRWTLLDPPYTLEDPINKNFIFNVFVMGFLGAVVGVFIVTKREA